MSDTAVNAYTVPVISSQEARPSFTKGLLWGGILSIGLWMVIGWMIARSY